MFIFILPKVPKTVSNYPYLRAFEVQNGENMEDALKINDYGKTLSFCKYLPNKSLDLHEILCGGQSLFCELNF